MRNVLHLGLSYACNMKCKHCFVNKKRDILKLQDYYRILDEVYDLGVFVLYYTYGEPLLSRFFYDVTAYARDKGFIQILMTNGYYIDRDTIRKIKNNGVNEVCVSLDHIDFSVHDNNRGLKGAYRHAIDAIELLVENEVPVGISNTISNQNVACMNDLLNLAIQKRVNYLSFLRQRNKGLCELSKENQRKYFDSFASCITNKIINVHFHDNELLQVLAELKKSNKIDDEVYEKYYEMNVCHKRLTLSIEPDGRVSDCNLMPSVIGNVINNKIENLLKERNCENEDSFCCCAISRQSGALFSTS